MSASDSQISISFSFLAVNAQSWFVFYTSPHIHICSCGLLAWPSSPCIKKKKRLNIQLVTVLLSNIIQDIERTMTCLSKCCTTNLREKRQKEGRKGSEKSIDKSSYLVIHSSNDFAEESEGQGPQLGPLPLQAVRVDQRLANHSAHDRDKSDFFLKRAGQT